MRKALVVGINHYENVGPLYGCVKDARSVNEMLERNADAVCELQNSPPHDGQRP